MSDLPFVSVVVPVFNGAEEIEDLLASLLALDYLADRHEIIVVDNGSTDNTYEVVKKYPVKLLKEQEIQGAAAARNKGIKHARGDIIAFTDADCVVDSNWLKMLVIDHDDASIGAFAGEVKGVEPAQTIVQAIYNHHHFLSPLRFVDMPDGQKKVEVKQRAPIRPRTILERLWVRLGLVTYYQKRPPMPPMCYSPTANVAFRRSVFDKIGLFDIGLLRGQDIEFSWRMQLKSDFRFHAAPQAVVYHKHRVTVRDLWAQRKRYGLARILILDKYIGLDSDVHRQAFLESCLNIIFGVPYYLADMAYKVVKSLVYGRPHPLYLYEPLVYWLSDLGYNYGRVRACLDGVRVNSQEPVMPKSSRPDLNNEGIL